MAKLEIFSGSTSLTQYRGLGNNIHSFDKVQGFLFLKSFKYKWLFPKLSRKL